MKGQYFSFDAVVAAIIVVLAFMLFAGYWLSMQAITDARISDTRQDAMRVAEVLLSPGAPADWNNHPITGAKQLGFGKNFSSSELDMAKIVPIQNFCYAGPAFMPFLRNLLSVSSNVSITIVRSDLPGATPIQVCTLPPVSANEVASAYRGATMDGHPYSVRVILYR